MKKISLFVISVLCLFSFSCKKKISENEIIVGATPVPHAAMLNLIVDDLKEAGYTLKVVEFTDYVTPNEAVESEEIDANFFQHLPYMESFNQEKGYHLVSFAGIHIEPLALYSNRIKNIDELKEGATIAIPNDPTNEGRALLLLQSAGLIKLDDKAGLQASPEFIISNIKNLKFREIEAASLPRVLNDVDAAVINGNYAIASGLNAKDNGLIVEGADSPYVNVLCTKKGKENSQKLKALSNALKSEKVKKYIEDTYTKGDVICVF